MTDASGPGGYRTEANDGTGASHCQLKREAGLKARLYLLHAAEP